MMRGYRTLHVRSQLGRITALQAALTVAPLQLPANGFALRVFGAALSHAELIVRQYLLTRVGGVYLTKAVLIALGHPPSRVVHPLPASWRQTLRDQGFEVDGARSGLLWACEVFKFFLYGVLTTCGFVLDSLRASFGKPPSALGRYAHFDSLAAGNIPRPSGDGRTHDVVTWYMQWAGRPATLDTLTHTVAGISRTEIGRTPVVPVSSPFPPLSGFASLTRQLAWAAAATTCAAVDLIRGRWWHALLMREAARAAVVRLQDPRRLARDYLFHNSGWIYRPLWTYEAERSGSRVLLYFYSTNCEAFKDSRGYPELLFGYRAMRWPRYLVWDKWQADFVYRAAGPSANVTIAGPIWFQSSNEATPPVGERAVAVFDVQPMRDSRYQALGMPSEYYVPKVACQFLLDIHSVLTEYGSEMVLKRKRHIGRLMHPRYRKAVDGLSRSNNFVPVDPDASALRVIEGCAAVLSMPFTSTAIIGRELGKPSAYYDPFGVIQKDDRAAHGIEVLCGPLELRAWISRVLGHLGPVRSAACGESRDPEDASSSGTSRVEF